MGAATAYLLGYLEMSFFASPFGLTAGDLGLDLRSYTMLAMLNAALVALVVAAMWSHAHHTRSDALQQWAHKAEKGWRRTVREIAAAAVNTLPVGVAMATGTVGFGLGRAAYPAMISVGLAGALALTLFREPQRRNLAYSFAAVTLVAVAAMPCWVAHRYAHQLRADVSAGRAVPLPPIALRAVLQPDVGLVTRGNLPATCVVRISPTAVLGLDAATTASFDSFTNIDCDVVRVPFR